MTGPLAMAFVAAFALAGVSTPLLIRLGRGGVLLDQPNPRSSHDRPTPRGGGIAIVLAFAVAVAVFGGQSAILVLLAAALAVASVGLLDDAYDLPVWPRLMAQVIIAAAVVLLIGRIDALSIPGVVRLSFASMALPATIVWIVAMTNFFNFMDGIDGLAAGQSILSAIVVIAAGWSGAASVAAAAMAGATGGFLLYNWSPARIFMGDAGSMTLGFLLASFPLLAPPARRADAMFATAIGLTLFLLDPTVTLLRRVFRGERIGQSHRDHAYQQLVRPGEMHGRASAGLLLGTVPLIVLGIGSFFDARLGPVAVCAGAVIYGVEVVLGRLRRVHD